MQKPKVLITRLIPQAGLDLLQEICDLEINPEEALAEAQALDGIGYFWSPLSRAATLGMLGRRNESASAVREILDLKPDFADRGHVLISHCVKFPEIRNRLIQGLAVGGLSVAGGSANS